MFISHSCVPCQDISGCGRKLWPAISQTTTLGKAIADVDVIDSSGNVVGPYYFAGAGGFLNGSATTLRKINDIWFQLPVLTTGFEQPVGGNIEYSGANCTGTAYMDAIPNALVLDATTTAAIMNGILYYPNPAIPPSAPTVCSIFLVTQSFCENSGCSGLADRQPAETVDLSSLNLTPPFQLKQTKKK
jgi:hypothetical protein